jgi:integrase
MVSATIAEIGKKAGVKVTHKSTATAHDLRRSFGHRWADRVRPHVLQQIMRHSAISTTMSFYVQAEADETAVAVWAAQKSTTISRPLSDDEVPAHEKTPA